MTIHPISYLDILMGNVYPVSISKPSKKPYVSNMVAHHRSDSSTDKTIAIVPAARGVGRANRNRIAKKVAAENPVSSGKPMSKKIVKSFIVPVPKDETNSKSFILVKKGSKAPFKSRAPSAPKPMSKKPKRRPKLPQTFGEFVSANRFAVLSSPSKLANHASKNNRGKDPRKPPVAQYPAHSKNTKKSYRVHNVTTPVAIPSGKSKSIQARKRLTLEKSILDNYQLDELISEARVHDEIRSSLVSLEIRFMNLVDARLDGPFRNLTYHTRSQEENIESTQMRRSFIRSELKVKLHHFICTQAAYNSDGRHRQARANFASAQKIMSLMQDHVQPPPTASDINMPATPEANVASLQPITDDPNPTPDDSFLHPFVILEDTIDDIQANTGITNDPILLPSPSSNVSSSSTIEDPHSAISAINRVQSYFKKSAIVINQVLNQRATSPRPFRLPTRSSISPNSPIVSQIVDPIVQPNIQTVLPPVTPTFPTVLPPGPSPVPLPIMLSSDSPRPITIDFTDAYLPPDDSSSSDSSFSSYDTHGVKKSKKKKKSRSTAKIMYELNKNATYADFKILENHPDLDKSSRAFLSFTRKLRQLLRTTPELRRVLEDPYELQEPKTLKASRALYDFLLSKVSDKTATMLETYMAEHKCNDGITAYKFLRTMSAPQDADSQHKSLTRFRSLFLQDNELLRSFHQRFNIAMTNVQATGQTISQPEIIDQYLRALQLITNPSLQVSITLLRNQRTEEGISTTNIVLSAIQTKFQRDQELTQDIVKTRSREVTTSSTTRTSTHHANKASTPNDATAKSQSSARVASSKPSYSSSSELSRAEKLKLMTCLGCQVKGHSIRNCSTTSASDKERLIAQLDANLAAKRKAEAHLAASTNPTNEPSARANVVERKLSFAHMARTRKLSCKTAASSQVYSVQSRVPVHSGESTASRVVVYEDDIVIDSGATDHFTGKLSNLHSCYPHYDEVMQADGSITIIETAGTMCVACKCIQTNTSYTIPLIGTCYVPGFNVNLWSVTSFNSSGHEVIFGLSTVRIIMHKDTATEFVIHLRHPYHRVQGRPQQAFMASSTTPTTIRQSMLFQHQRKKHVHLELMHRRLGHAATKTLLAASEADLYADIKIDFEPTGPCLDCQVATIRSSNKGKKSVGDSTKPGQVWFADLIDNPSRVGITTATFYPYYMNLVDSYSRYQVFVGMQRITASSCISAFEQLGSTYRPSRDFTLSDISEIHVDAGSQLMSREIQRWSTDRDHPITIIAAAPAHQEQNGKAEANWKHSRQIAFKLLTHARLNLAFFDMALRYAWQIRAILPFHGLNLETDGQVSRPSTPFECYFGKKPSIGRFKVFGCPCVVKVHARNNIASHASAQHLTSKNIIQRGVRGIFVGFPINQAGYLVWIPASGHLLATADVNFDEDFTSPLGYPDRLFHDAIPTRNATIQLSDVTVSPSHTGPPFVIPDDVDPNSPWTPFTSLPPEKDVDTLQAIMPLVDSIPASHDYHLEEEEEEERSLDSSESTGSPTTSAPKSPFDNYNLETSSGPSQNPSIESNSPLSTVVDQQYVPPSPIRRSQRERRPVHNPDFIYSKSSRTQKQALSITSRKYMSFALASVNSSKNQARKFVPVAEDLLDAISPEPGSNGSDPSFFIPEPRNLKQISRMPTRYSKPWIAAFVKEFTGLCNMQSFVEATPPPESPITPVMDLYKCKLDKTGMIDKLKCRIVFRGDLYEPTEPEDSWNPFATYLAFRLYLAICAQKGIFPDQTDLVQAYLQCKMRENVYIIIPLFWAEFLPPHLQKYCGVPLRLLRALYGYTYSGKRLYEDQAAFLKEQGLTQSPLLGIWYRHLENNGLLIILLFADDFLSACTDSVVHTEFRTALQTRFQVETHPRADWYLQARIQQDHQGNITLDQHRYSQSIWQRYIPNADAMPTPSDIRRYSQPVPSDYKWKKEDNAKSREESQQLAIEFGFSFIEVVGSLNYLANTAIRQLFAIRKTCKYMHQPGRLHYQALLHLLHHIRCHPARPLIFYKDVKTSPLAKLLVDAGHPNIDPTFCYFCDSAFMDADDSRSTGCYLGFFQGGLIDFSSSVPLPVAMSSAEAELNYASITCMAASITRRTIMAILYDDENRSFSVPLFTDSTSMNAISLNDRDTKRIRHVDRRFLFVRYCRQTGQVHVNHVDGDNYQLADVGTKSGIIQRDFDFKMSHLEAPLPLTPKIAAFASSFTRRGVMKSKPHLYSESQLHFERHTPNDIGHAPSPLGMLPITPSGSKGLPGDHTRLYL